MTALLPQLSFCRGIAYRIGFCGICLILSASLVQAQVTTSINDNVTGTGVNQWDYTSGGWSYYNGSNLSSAYLGDEHYAFTTNATAHFRFSGQQVKIYTVKEPPGGFIGYSLDGGAEQQISNYASTITGNSLSYTSPVVAQGDHDLVVRVVGSHEASATSNTITVDRAEIIGDAPTPTPTPNYWSWAETPPRGWNSYDCFGNSVTESQVKTAADYMAANLKQFGYEYVVVDFQWYDGAATGFSSHTGTVTMDGYGRLQPALNRFPSAANGLGFKPLADYVHAKGLKFGLHMMRGIPRQAYSANTPIFGTPYHAQDVGNPNSTCRWNFDMYGVDTTKPGAQEYYNSVVNQWAAWGVDFIKIDDLTADPGLPSNPYYTGEVEAYRQAIDQSGRQIVFSTSPGETALSHGPHVSTHANMWRISDDFWDSWTQLLPRFEQLNHWTPYRGPGHFPDADMLPLGKIGAGNSDPNAGRMTLFTVDEQYTLMTLWAIGRSPLMYGGDLSQMDAFTLGLITNSEVLAVNQSSNANQQLFNQNLLYAWVANDSTSDAKYLAVFNARNSDGTGAGTAVAVNLADLGFSGDCMIRDLWQHAELGTFNGTFAPVVPWHGAKLYRVISPYDYNDFAQQHFTTGQLADQSISGLYADPNKDGITNLLAYALQLHPFESSVDKLPEAEISGGYLTLTYNRLHVPLDVTYTVEVSSDLVTWNSGAGYTTELSVVAINPLFDSITVRDNTAASSGRRFMRIRITPIN